MVNDPACYWVYIILCNNNRYYTGYTHDLIKRYQSHVDGTGRCKYTRSFKPVRLVQSWQIRGNKAQAMYIEREIKKLTHAQKQQLIAEPASIIHYFPDGYV